mmetsp:Transcript_20265/g.61057  ORF Transcript_20265/g.61057 Transcript_20265/m.61057 type:complete len:277 (+) Transcript_20265:69-899(+)
MLGMHDASLSTTKAWPPLFLVPSAIAKAAHMVRYCCPKFAPSGAMTTVVYDKAPPASNLASASCSAAADCPTDAYTHRTSVPAWPMMQSVTANGLPASWGPTTSIAWPRPNGVSTSSPLNPVVSASLMDSRSSICNCSPNSSCVSSVPTGSLAPCGRPCQSTSFPFKAPPAATVAFVHIRWEVGPSFSSTICWTPPTMHVAFSPTATGVSSSRISTKHSSSLRFHMKHPEPPFSNLIIVPTGASLLDPLTIAIPSPTKRTSPMSTSSASTFCCVSC